MATEGAKVVISSRKEEKVQKAVELLKKDNLECHGLVCHIAKKSDRIKLIEEVTIFNNTITYNSAIAYNLYKKAVDKYGGIDIIVSNAAINPSFGPIFDVNC